MNGYRRELKYVVDDRVLADVRNRVSTIMSLDPHQKGDFYNIRSIYLDNDSLECLRQNEAGVSTREKYRIRAYDCMDSKISAEVKIRHRDTISKMAVDISKDALEAVIDRDVYTACDILMKEKQDLLRLIDGLNSQSEIDELNQKIRAIEKYIMKLAGKFYSPAVIVDYERCAYVYDACNVRITFDRNVTASREYDRFFDKSLQGRPAIEEGKHVLEIKYDEFLPDEIAYVLKGCELVRGSCSKYARCMYAFEI